MVTKQIFRFNSFAVRSVFLTMLVAFASREATQAATISVININDSGPGSLRQAILDSNLSTGVLDTVSFNISGAGVHTISPTSGLPTITDPVIIDGYTQPGSSANTLTNGDDAVLLIELDGSNAGQANGLVVFAGNSVVRGLVIDRFHTPCCTGFGFGILLSNNNNVVEGNFIGTDPSGTVATGNGDAGVVIEHGFGNTIGGPNPAARNILSGNQTFGVNLCCGSASGGHVIQGNYIGTDVSGTTKLANTAGGMRIAFSASNTVGGATATARNLISGNTGDGVEIEAIEATGNTIQGNYIGTQIDGISPLGNGKNGVTLLDGTTSNLIGGTSTGDGNVIAFNLGGGVVVGGGRIAFGEDTDNAILGNSIFSNTGLGIDLLAADPIAGNISIAGLTTNDACDADSGENRLQNYPVVNLFSNVTEGILVQGILDSSPNTSFRVEFFTNPFCDPSGSGQGETFLGFTNLTTGANCSNSFNVVFPGFLAPGAVVTATATDPDGNTSEFSLCRKIPHNLAVVSVKPPKTITLSDKTPTVTKRVSVQIQNLSPHAEDITDADLSSHLVTLVLSNLHSDCPPPVAELVTGPPNIVFKTVKPKGKFNVFFNVTFSTNCVPDVEKGTEHTDFNYVATVNHAVLDGEVDTVPSNDTCPRGPTGSDKGCGGKNPNTKQLGADVVTDVTMK